MKEININIDDELYRRARRKFDDLESSVSQYVTDYLESLNEDNDRIAAARSRMAELFQTTTGFGVGIKPTREEMHERRSVH
jgi:DNA replication initiation complex subunit (GINS family)